MLVWKSLPDVPGYYFFRGVGEKKGTIKSISQWQIDRMVEEGRYQTRRLDECQFQGPLVPNEKVEKPKKESSEPPIMHGRGWWAYQKFAFRDNDWRCEECHSKVDTDYLGNPSCCRKCALQAKENAPACPNCGTKKGFAWGTGDCGCYG
jgi:hypothetical protein